MAENQGNRVTISGEELDGLMVAESRTLKRYIENLWGIVLQDVALERVKQTLSDPSSREAYADLIAAMIRGWGQEYSEGYQELLESVTAKVAKYAKLSYVPGDIVIPTTARNEAGRFIVEITNGVREAIRGGMFRYVEGTISRDDAAELVRRLVTLTSREAGWVWRSHERAYNTVFSELISEGMSATAAQAKAMQAAKRAADGKYRSLHKARVERIVRTESSRLKHSGELNALRIAENSGQIANVTATWNRTAFNDNWPSSIINDGQTVPLNGMFPSGAYFPDEINERCVLNYNFERVE